MECDVCKTKVKPLFQCDTCNKGICKSCGKLSASEVKVLELKGERILRFDCSSCQKFKPHILLQKAIEDKNKIIESKEEIIALLQQKIESLESRKYESNALNSLQYSDILKKPLNPTKQTTTPSLIIKPKKQQSIEKMKEELRKKINPTELKISINSIKSTKNGNLLVKCQEKNDMDILKNVAEKKLNDYNIEMTKLRNPRFKIIEYKINDEDDLKTEIVEASIREQNHFIEPMDYIKITYFKLNKKSESYTVYGNCSAKLFHKIMANKKLCIGWQRYTVFEDISVPRCFKCQGFFHKNTECPNEGFCEYCSEIHSAKECPKKQKRCINCLKANEKYNLKHNVNHTANDKTCPSFEHQIKIMKSKIDYDGNYGE